MILRKEYIIKTVKKSNDFLSEFIFDLNNSPSFKTLKFEKNENDLVSDNSYHNNNSIEFVEKSRIDIIKYLKHMLNNCLDQAHSISGCQIEDFDYLAVFINTSEISVAEARNKFKKFKYEWYFKHSDDFDEGIIFYVT